LPTAKTRLLARFSTVIQREGAGQREKQAEEEVGMEPNDESNEQDEGGLKKKVATGVAVGLATTAAAGVAKKLLSGGDDENGDVQETAENQGRQAGSSGGRTAQGAQSGATRQARSTAGSTRRTTKAGSGSAKKRSSQAGSSAKKASSQARSTAKKSSSQTRSTAKKSSSQARSAAKKSSTQARSTAKATTRSAGSTASRDRTKEQLYNQAKRLKIDGRSNMTKAQLERAIARAK
jgi:hypothetical protein